MGTENALAKKEAKTIVIQGHRSEVLARSGDKILAYRSYVRLKPGKHTYEFRGQPRLMADAYLWGNSVAGISLLAPATVVVDGVERPNPYIERDPETRTVTNVHCHKIAIGRGPSGKISAVDLTVAFSIQTYFLQSLQKKIKDEKASANIGIHGIESMKPENIKNPVFIAIDNLTGLWVDIYHAKIQECFQEHIQRQRFAERIAQTITERNCLRKHPCFGGGNIHQTPGENGKRGELFLVVEACAASISQQDVDGWIGQLQNSGTVTADEVHREDAVEADFQEVIAEGGAIAAAEGDNGAGSERTAPDPETLKRAKLINDIAVGASILGKGWDAIKDDLSIPEKLQDLKTPELEEIRSIVNNRVDKLNAGQGDG